MAYTAVPTKSPGDTWSASDHNTYIRDNFAAGVPDIFTTKGDLAVASGADAAGRLGVGSNGQILSANSAETLGLKWISSGAAGCAGSAKVSSTKSLSHNTTTIINFDTVVFDTDGAITTGSSWKFTVPSGKGGYYLVCAAALLESSSAWGANEYFTISLYKNGSLYRALDARYMQAAGTYQVFLAGSGLISLAAGDYIDIRALQISGSTINIDASGDYTHVSIVRII